MRRIGVFAMCLLFAASTHAYTMRFDENDMNRLLDRGEVDLKAFNEAFDWSKARPSYADWFADMRGALSRAMRNEEGAEELYFYISHELDSGRYTKESTKFKRLVRSERAGYRTDSEIGWEKDKINLRVFLVLFGNCLDVDVRQYHVIMRVDRPGQVHLPGRE